MKQMSRYDRKRLSEEWVAVKAEYPTVGRLLIESGAIIRYLQSLLGSRQGSDEEQELQFIDLVAVAVEDVDANRPPRQVGSVADCFKPARAGAEMPTPEEAEACVQRVLRGE